LTLPEGGLIYWQSGYLSGIHISWYSISKGCEHARLTFLAWSMSKIC
jgi:hypothetical protein